MTGQKRCRLHGGASPQAMRKGAERAAESRLRAEVARMDAGPIDDPVKWLQDVAGEVSQWLALCRGHLDHATSVDESAAIVHLYERALSRAVDTAEKVVRLGIDRQWLDAREMKLAEETAGQFRRVLERVVTALADAHGFTITPAEMAAVVTAALDAEQLT